MFFECRRSVIVHHRVPDEPREAVLNDPQSVATSLASGCHPVDEGLSFRVGSQACHRHDVEHRVDASIPVAVEPMVDRASVELGRRSWDWGCPRVAPKGISGTESAWVADFDQQVCCPQRPETKKIRK